VTAYSTLISRRDGPVEHLTLNRPEVRNAFNDTMIAELSAWAAAIHDATDVGVVIIAGAGKTFSAGADLAWMAKTVRYSKEENTRDALAAARMFSAINSLPVPVVGRVHGAALGGGAGLAAVCDIVVTEEQAVFGFTEVKLGIIPAVISPFVLAKIGHSAVRELFLTGGRFSAARALELKLVHQVVSDQGLDTAVARYVSELLTGGREAVAAAKALIAQISNASPEAVQVMTANAIATRRVSAEGQEGLKAFLEKRTPGWSAS
jgi:methylglutaconyl-CoA hydratase